ncbi:bacteriocin immunity protein [Lactococcus taiwanensis]|uniref:Bacteriocin immunity protein n=1 Tax=Lactococcus taiwanensis TaxID=1151742 RepID=A0AA45KFU9_9LACT|nr:bacteriocin immunity protein [Lactococcus taiwanensis]
MNEIMDQEKALNALYNLILDRHIRDWERSCLLTTKQRIEAGRPLGQELARLEAQLRPLALRYNLTPQVNEFYQAISNSKLFGPGVGGII